MALQRVIDGHFTRQLLRVGDANIIPGMQVTVPK